MPYLYHTDDERRQMLEVLGLQSTDDLFDHIPAELRIEARPFRPWLRPRRQSNRIMVILLFRRLAVTSKRMGFDFAPSVDSTSIS